MKYLFCTVICWVILTPHLLKATNDTVHFKETDKIIIIGNCIKIYEDTSNKLTLSDVLKINSFNSSKELIPNLGLSNSIFWIK